MKQAEGQNKPKTQNLPFTSLSAGPEQSTTTPSPVDNKSTKEVDQVVPVKKSLSAHFNALDRRAHLLILLIVCLILAILLVGIFKFIRRDNSDDSPVAETTESTSTSVTDAPAATVQRSFVRPDVELSSQRGKRHYSYLPEVAKHLFLFDGNLILSDGNYLTYMTYSGSTIDEDVAEFTDPFLCDSDSNTALVADLQGSNYALIGKDGIKKLANVDNTCVSGALNGQNNYALVEVTAQRQGLVHVYDYASDKRLFTIQFADSDYPMDLRFNPSQQSLDVLLSNTRGNNLESVLKSYDLNGKQISEVSLSNDGDLLTEITYDNQGRTVVVGTHKCIRLNDAEELAKFDFSGSLINYFENKGELSFLINNDQQELSFLKINGDQLDVINVPLRNAGVGSSAIHNNTLLLSVGTELYRFDITRRQFIDYLDVGSSVVHIESYEDNVALITSNVLLTLK